LGNPGKRHKPQKPIRPNFGGRIYYRSPKVIIPFLSSENNKILPIFNNFSVANIYFNALIDSGATVNVMNMHYPGTSNNE
jgi:hypothetical protein